MKARALMFQGTGSDVGKSVLVAGLCRVFYRRGFRVLPFKPQNMSNNAAVTAEGGEIGRAQQVQALACHAELSVHMNPVLLKPQSDMTAQVVVQGQVRSAVEAADYQLLRASLMDAVLDSYERLRSDADLVLIEGAGSPAEINLRDRDIANMGFALPTQTPVALIGDIDRGGVIASLVGTVDLLPAEERALIRGYIINKFRGDLSLFDDGLVEITNRTGLPSFGVMPWVKSARQLPAEDAVILDSQTAPKKNSLRVAVPLLSRIANFDDLDPLRAEPNVEVTMIPPGRPLPRDADLIIMPGTKATLADMEFVRSNGWDIDIQAHVRQGGRVLGLCGGYQMLGCRIIDEDGLEGRPGSVQGLGLLDLETRLQPQKILRVSQGCSLPEELPVEGYEIHMGVTNGADCARPMLRLDGHAAGAQSGNRLVQGCYLHGLFTSDEFRAGFLDSIRSGAASAGSYKVQLQSMLDDLADNLEAALDIEALLAAFG